jgi:pimeloyl-ACP methyl ester carboxylesterase
MPRIETPVGYAVFPKELIEAPDRWIESGHNIVQKTVMPKGGHFAALEQPDLLLKDIRTFFAKLNQ